MQTLHPRRHPTGAHPVDLRHSVAASKGGTIGQIGSVGTGVRRGKLGIVSQAGIERNHQAARF
jgi:hypothetical protein